MLEQPIRRVLLIHGWNATPDSDFLPWLRRELGEYGFSVFAPQMPNAKHPKVSGWLEHLRHVVVSPDKETYFVGHSLGCITIARYLVSLHGDVCAGGCVFVGGFSGNIHIPEISEFYSLPFEAQKAKQHCRAFTAILSDDDTAVPLDIGLAFAHELGAKVVVEKKRGHFCKSDGVTELPSALSAVLELAGQKALSPKP